MKIEEMIEEAGAIELAVIGTVGKAGVIPERVKELEVGRAGEGQGWRGKQ